MSTRCSSGTARSVPLVEPGVLLLALEDDGVDGFRQDVAEILEPVSSRFS
jgi:hypothetical protein